MCKYPRVADRTAGHCHAVRARVTHHVEARLGREQVAAAEHHAFARVGLYFTQELPTGRAVITLVHGPPVDRDGDFVIAPPYVPAPELKAASGIARGRIEQVAMESADSKFFPGIARTAPGTVDPDNPRTLRLEVRPQPYQRAITVYLPAGMQPG